MVDFAGYSLPVQYPDGLVKSHLHTRSEGCASLFDVSHMGQICWKGKDVHKFLERITVVDMEALKPVRGREQGLPVPCPPAATVPCRAPRR